jgi:hypothetical protein
VGRDGLQLLYDLPAGVAGNGLHSTASAH